jgi:hypothetical protein
MVSAARILAVCVTIALLTGCASYSHSTASNVQENGDRVPAHCTAAYSKMKSLKRR